MLDSINRSINKVLEFLIVTLFVVLVFLVLWQVFSRYALNDPSTITDELSRFLLIHVAMLGSAYTASKKRHLAIDLFTVKLTGRSKLASVIIYHSAMIVFSAVVMVYGGVMFAEQTIRFGQIASSLDMKIGYFFIVVPVSGIFLCYYSTMHLIKEIKDYTLNKDIK